MSDWLPETPAWWDRAALILVARGKLRYWGRRDWAVDRPVVRGGVEYADLLGGPVLDALDRIRERGLIVVPPASVMPELTSAGRLELAGPGS